MSMANSTDCKTQGSVRSLRELCVSSRSFSFAPQGKTNIGILNYRNTEFWLMWMVVECHSIFLATN